MTPSYARLVRLTFLLSSFLPLVVATCTGALSLSSVPVPLSYWIAIDIGVPVALVFSWLFGRLLQRLDGAIDELAREQAAFLDRLPTKHVQLAIGGSAALSLFLELAVIRWQGTVWEFFAFYKNMSLLSCFAGLGLGYALARRDSIPLVFTAPLLGFQILLLEALRHGMGGASRSLLVLPFQEQLNMGIPVASSSFHYVAVYFFITVVFLLTALTFLPVGQLCGRLMERRPSLDAYGLNLLGSLGGVALMLGTSVLWTPPSIWFSLCLLGIIVFQVFRQRALVAAILATLATLGVLIWPTSFGWERIYSPYQLLERGAGERGLMMIRAAGHYYQRVHDLSYPMQLISPRNRLLGNYYELPYRLRPRPPGRVAIVGAGTGNDVAAALRAGSGSVDAIEIDPAILDLGRMYHPEYPYSDPRVHFVNDDARSFLRTTRSRYDLVVYGLLDSHTLLSHASSVRLDSFVYTVEGLREARARLRDDGIVSLSFAVLSNELGRKIYLMMREAFEGHPPVCVFARYDGSVIFLQSKDGDLKVPAELLSGSGFVDFTSRYADPALQADVSTDDWPFFYMPRRVYPRSYLFMVGLVLGLSVVFFASFLSERPRFNQAAFFFLGAGFMLVETKGITELGLALGNTWQVIGIVIAGVLVMAYLANGVVAALRVRRPIIPYLLLLTSLAVGLAIARSGGFAPTTAGKLATVLVLTCPVFFSGVVFSTLIAGTERLSGAMALNLLGAMCGGLLEYNSLYFGFQFLYRLAIALYLVAALTTLARRQTGPAPPAAPPA
jgi:SAM-dependent methyltransferase